MQNAKPFLKWAGGKTQLLNEISKKIPFSTDEEFIYIEPFLGSGAVLFWVLKKYTNLKKIIVNDLNEDLVNCFNVVKADVEVLIKYLKIFQDEFYELSEDLEKKKMYYYNKRMFFNSKISSKTEQAALFIFLNRTCFNGLFRVNKKNEFNVPIGSYKKPLICDKENLKLVSDSLKKVTIINEDFEKTLSYAEKKSFYYLDPPYKPLSGTASFNSYTKEDFNDFEQIRLKRFCDKLDMVGSRWMLSNSDVKGKNSKDDFFDKLFVKYNIKRVFAKRSINANPSKRGELTELLITN